MQTISPDQLGTVTGGESTDPTAALKRSSEAKPGHGSIDIFGYAESERSGVGLEARHRLTPSISVFGRGQVGMKNDKPDNSITGGIRFEW